MKKPANACDHCGKELTLQNASRAVAHYGGKMRKKKHRPTPEQARRAVEHRRLKPNDKWGKKQNADVEARRD